MSPALRPRQLVHRGVVEASALLVNEALSGPLTARRRVVAAWSPGATVHRLGAALLLRFHAPRRVDCARAPGLPLVRVSDAPGAPLASAPLAPDELAAAAPPRDALLLVRGGALTTVVLAEADREDPATYLDLDGFAVVLTDALGPAPPPPQVVAEPTTAPARGLFGVAAAPSDQGAAIAALQAARAGASPGKPGVGAADGPSFFASFLATLATLLARLSPAGGAPSAAGATAPYRGASRALQASPQEPAGPSLAERLTARLRGWLAEALVRARLARLVGRRQAAYFERLLGMFDRGDLTEALRHAIPLDGAGSQSAGPSFGVPSPRADLTIPLGQRRAAGSAIFTEGDFYAHLRAKYRAAFERLEREGRIDEAAFVLAELLHEDAEAIAFLERHGRLRLAAELAEARRLPPGLVVRQWFLAGDVARAVLVARRHGAFADALVRLEKHARAPELRLRWAEVLAAAGDFAAAVDVIWPIEEARRLGAAWIDAAIDQGGAAAARMLVRKLSLVPASFPEVRARVLALVADDAAVGERRAFADALLRLPVSTAAARTLARPTVRAMIRDAARSGDAAAQERAAKLSIFSADLVLRADRPTWPTVERTPLARLDAPCRIELAASDTGTTPVLDAAFLPDGRTVVALGEAGVRVLDRDGRPLFHLDQPAQRLVVSDHGDRALALARRGPDTWRLARLDLVGRRSEPWCEASFGAFARDFDGSQWVVAVGHEVMVIDALETRFEALASFRLGPIGAIGRSAGACAVVALPLQAVRRAPGADPSWQRAHYELPTWTLRGSKPLQIPAVDALPFDDTLLFATSASRTAALVVQPPDRLGLWVSHEASADRQAEISFATALRDAARQLAVSDTWIACAAPDATGEHVRLIDAARVEVRAHIRLDGARQVGLRLAEDTLTVSDDRGRVLVVDLRFGGLIRDFRV